MCCDMAATVIYTPTVFVSMQLTNIVTRFVTFIVSDASGNLWCINRLLYLYANGICFVSGGICIGADIGG